MLGQQNVKPTQNVVETMEGGKKKNSRMQWEKHQTRDKPDRRMHRTETYLPHGGAHVSTTKHQSVCMYSNPALSKREEYAWFWLIL